MISILESDPCWDYETCGWDCNCLLCGKPASDHPRFSVWLNYWYNAIGGWPYPLYKAVRIWWWARHQEPHGREHE